MAKIHNFKRFVKSVSPELRPVSRGSKGRLAAVHGPKDDLETLINKLESGESEYQMFGRVQDAEPFILAIDREYKTESDRQYEAKRNAG